MISSEIAKVNFKILVIYGLEQSDFLTKNGKSVIYGLRTTTSQLTFEQELINNPSCLINAICRSKQQLVRAISTVQ